MRSRKRILRRAKNGFLKGVSYAAFILFILSGAAIDSESLLPTLICMASFGWLILFKIANEGRVEEWLKCKF